MLSRLKVENYTVLPQVEVQFAPGLNVITGETGVGKSLLLDAVGYILGERRTGFPIRAGCSRAVVEAEFSPQNAAPLRTWLQQNTFSADLPLLLRREFMESGRTRLFINDTPATLNQSRDLGNLLLDLHGQHEMVALFDRARQLIFLDDYAQQPLLVQQYKQQFSQLKHTQGELEALQERINDSRQGQETLLRQQRELETLNPKPGEKEALDAELKKLENAERIFELCEEICNRLNEAPGSALEQLAAVLKRWSDLYLYDPTLRSWETELENVRSVLSEANRTLQELSQSVRHDPRYVEQRRERLMVLIGFRKQWNTGERDLTEVAEDLRRQLQGLNQLSGEAAKLEERLHQIQTELLETGKTLSQRRQAAAKKLEKQVAKKLGAIGMPKANFKVQFATQQTDPPYSDGLDRIEFTLSPDGKLPHQPLRQVASGGEMSRILLALKCALAYADQVDTLIFDEIDQGISGRVARLVGEQLLELARSHQVIVVTHLAQIASLGHRHFSVRAVGGGDAAIVQALTDEERVEELASLLAASGLSAGALLNAREMLSSAQTLQESSSFDSSHG